MKTYIAAAIAAFGAANGILHILPDSAWQTIMALAVSLGLIGIRHAIATGK